jgi:hypothetical protein
MSRDKRKDWLPETATDRRQQRHFVTLGKRRSVRCKRLIDGDGDGSVIGGECRILHTQALPEVGDRGRRSQFEDKFRGENFTQTAKAEELQAHVSKITVLGAEERRRSLRHTVWHAAEIGK